MMQFIENTKAVGNFKFAKVAILFVNPVYNELIQYLNYIHIVILF